MFDPGHGQACRITFNNLTAPCAKNVAGNYETVQSREAPVRRSSQQRWKTQVVNNYLTQAQSWN